MKFHLKLFMIKKTIFIIMKFWSIIIRTIKEIKVDFIEYILIDKNNWKFFDSKSGKINDLQ